MGFPRWLSMGDRGGYDLQCTLYCKHQFLQQLYKCNIKGSADRHCKQELCEVPELHCSN